MNLNDKYAHKITNVHIVAGLTRNLFSESPKVVMCHGVFDVVHPGHLRHLLYAKSKGDILIVSITADVHITKGHYRPHIPQDLRALNLAAYEFVDYVIIDENPKPIKNLEIIKPDFYAKGYEYSAGNHPNTAEETALVTSYGGQVIFTPGDYVLSSSKLIEQSPPNLRVEKLVSLLHGNQMTFRTLRHALDGLGRRKVHVVGDTIVDTFTYTNIIGGLSKTPTLSALYLNKVDYVGGAAVVAKHLAAAGADVTFTTVIGDDKNGQFVVEDLEKSGVWSEQIVDAGRPTTNKNVIIAGGYRMLKIDTVDNRSISDDVAMQIRDQITSVNCDAVVFSDYRHGIFNRRTISGFSQCIQRHTYTAADSQVASRWGNVTDFQGFDLITPNEREARFALGDQDTGIRPLASQLYDTAKCKLLILKMGDKGVLTCRDVDHESLDSFYVVDSFANNVVDPVGAGDALLAYSLLTMLATKNDTLATIIGSLAAACECERDGNIPITRDDIRKKIDDIEREANFECAAS